MTRHLILAVVPVLLFSSCDPFDILGPRKTRPVPRQPTQQQAPRTPSEAENTQPQPDRDTRPVTERYPVAERTTNPNQVISPFAPFNVIDVTGFNSGQLARDPTNNEIFRIP